MILAGAQGHGKPSDQSAAAKAEGQQRSVLQGPKEHEQQIKVVNHRLDQGWSLQRKLFNDDSGLEESGEKTERSPELVWGRIVENRKDGNDDVNELIAYQDLMIWAVFMDDYALAVLFWKLGGNAIPNALVVARLADAVARHGKLQAGKYAGLVESFSKTNTSFEKKAIDVLNLCYVEDPYKTAYVLQAKLDPYGWLKDGDTVYNCLDLAIISESQTFIAQAASQSVIDRLWRGLPKEIVKIDFSSKIAGKVIDVDDPPPFGFGFAPRTKFAFDCVAYAMFMLLYSYVCLAAIEDELSAAETVLGAWVFALCVEEIRQTTEDGFTKLAFLKWARSPANQKDLLMYAVFIATFSVRVRYQDDAGIQRLVKGLYGINVQQVYWRSLEMAKASETLGPKIIIFEKLFAVFFHFLVLLSVFIISFGIFVQTTSRPYGPSETGTDWGDIVWRVWFRPYFQIYGELYLEDMQSDSSCIGDQFPWSSCGSNIDRLVPIITAVYVLITNIMILNMMVAAFTTTYEAIEEQAGAIYKKEMLRLYDDYKDRTNFPSPVNLPFVLANTAKDLMSSKDESNHSEKSDFVQLIEKFQDTIADRYAEADEDDEDAEISDQITTLKFTLMEAIAQLDTKAEAHFAYFDATNRASSNRLENARHLADAAKAPKPAPRTRTFVGRYASYPVLCPIGPIIEDADEELYSSSFGQPVARQANKLGNPIPNAPNQHLPTSFNPASVRTGALGLRGIGSLKRAGENRMLVHLVTRWKRGKDDIRMEREGYPMLEFLAVKRTAQDDKWSLPEAMYEDYSPGWNTPGSTCDPDSPVAVQAFNLNNMKPGVPMKLALLFLKKLGGFFNDESSVDDDIFWGFMDDERNTDEAWVSIKAEHFHDEADVFSKFNFQDPQGVAEVAWLSLHKDVDLYAEQEHLLERVAKKLHSFW